MAVTAADRLFQSYRDAIADVEQAEAHLHCAREACLDAEKRKARLREAVRLHVEEGMDPMQASVIADGFEEGVMKMQVLGQRGLELFRPSGNPRSHR